MNERQWWGTRVKPALHQPLKRWLAWKVQDAAFKGLPDTILNARGTIALAELKYITAWPRRTERQFADYNKKAGVTGKAHNGLSPEQRNHLQQWQDAGGNSYCLLGVGKTAYWVRFNLMDPRGWTQDELVGHSLYGGLKYSALDQIMINL